MSVDIAALLSDQPIVEDGGEQNLDEGLDGSSLEGSDYSSADGLGDEPPEGDSQPDTGRKQQVPLKALHEERTRRQESEQELAREREATRTLNERLTKLLELQQAAQTTQPPPEAVPEFVDDPEAAFKHLQRQLAESQRQMQEYLSGAQQQTQVQHQHAQLAQHVASQEAQFTQTVPDYPQAAEYFYQRKVAEYAAFTGDEFAAKQQVANDYKGIASLAQRLGKNPAELMYNAAKAMGYQPGQKPANGQDRKDPPTSLANVHGSPRAPDEKGKISAADISSMSEAEFDKYWNELKRGSTVKPRI